MKLTLEMWGTTYSVTNDHEGVTITEMIDLLRSLLLAAGFHPNTVNDALGEP